MEHTENTGAADAAQTTGPAAPTDSRSTVDTGLRILFEEMQYNFITRSRKDIAIELKKMENRTALLQDKINTLHTEVDRLVAIDLDTEFKRMQATLVHIAQGVNNINGSFGSVGANVGDGLNGTNATIRHYADETTKQLAKLDEETKTSILFLEHKIQSLTEQNKMLKKGIRSNNVITILGILLMLGGIAYIIGYQAGIRIHWP